MICEVFDDFILKVLIVAAIVNTVIGMIDDPAHGWVEGCGILFAICVIVFVTVGNDMVKEKQFQELMAKGDVAAARVRRDDKESTMDTETLVVGDIIFIGTGETIPADCLVIESNDLSCSEAALTGEPEGIHKEPATAENFGSLPDPFLLQSSLVEKGTCKAIVLAVGDNTNQGRAGLSMNIESEQTPLQRKLDSIAESIGKLGVIVAVLTFIASVVILLINCFTNDDMSFMSTQTLKSLGDSLIISITVVVVAVPEGLPLAVTISLAYSVGKMADENNLVRKLASSETMGNANEIATDKTGTLTQNKMTVQSGYFQDQVMDGETNDALAGLESAQDIKESVIFNSTAFIETTEDG